MRHADPFDRGNWKHPKAKLMDRPCRDRSVNEDIQEKGVEFWGAGSEYAWYQRNKGYSKKIEEQNA